MGAEKTEVVTGEIGGAPEEVTDDNDDDDDDDDDDGDGNEEEEELDNVVDGVQIELGKNVSTLRFGKTFCALLIITFI